MSAATELRVFETTTWKELGRIQTSSPFWSAVASHDGQYLYAAAPAQHRILVIDAVTLQERRAIEVGNVPSQTLIAP
jgi:DNA-binding beta-propeller fold protein YncE